MQKRALGDEMFAAFQEGGALHALLVRVQKDDTLDLEFRGDYATIYYRGGVLFNVQRTGATYQLEINPDYLSYTKQRSLASTVSVAEGIKKLPLYKEAIDFKLAENPTREREFQQLVVRENNRNGTISHHTDYYILDMEYRCEDGSEFDMIVMKWWTKHRGRPQMPHLAVIEMKYGDDAIEGTNASPGMFEHLEDFKRFYNNEDMGVLCKDMTEVFRQKCKLGLISKVEEYDIDSLTISEKEVEFIFLLANHQPDTAPLRNAIKKIKKENGENPYPFIRFAYASMMGYALYADQMKTLAQMQEILGING